MDPLSPFTYYRRHKRQTLLLLLLISLMTVGISFMVRLPDSFLEHMAYSESYKTRVSLVSAIGPTMDPSIVSQIRSHPDVAQVMQEKGVTVIWPPITGDSHLFSVSEFDMQALLDTFDLRLKEGRLPQPRTNEMVLSETMARGAKVWIGDEINNSSNQNWLLTIPSPLTVVGILEDDGTSSRPGPPVGIVSYEYVNGHELFASPWAPGLIVIAKEGRRAAVDDFLETAISPYAKVRTNRQLVENFVRVSRNFHLLFGVVDVLVALAIALVVGLINQIALSKRLAEFGVLHALGNDKDHLVRRLATETVIVTALGWITGLALSWGFFALLKVKLYEPNGINLSLANFTPIVFSIPVPLAAVVFVAWNTRRTMGRLDAVAIIERDQLSTEVDEQQSTARSTDKPLSSWTFYLRHRRRGLALTVTMGLMILGVAFPGFVFGPMMDAWLKIFEHLRQVSVVSPLTDLTIDPAVSAQIRGYADVADMIPAIRLQIRVDVPPMSHPKIPLYGVSERDLQTLIDLYGVRVEQGRLPHPRTNEIILSKALAQNRNWRVGDKIGRAYDKKEDDELPSEMVVVGNFSSPPGQEDLWTGFVSFEYLDSHEFYASYPVNMLVLPREGRKSEMDAWLEGTVAAEQTAVQTFDRMQTEYRIATWIILVLFGIIEGVIAIVAAVALAILSTIFFIQRREEFGVLHAIGHRRRWLVLRSTRESASVVAVAWLLGAVLCGIGLIAMQVGIFAPKGMTFNLLNPAPWVFTLPMPIAVVTVSTGLIAWMLFRLDPIAVIERRT
ncbi:MAG: ABC transporter permease [Anaerolineae bacterium]|nr:ABC transporter permease [Anaerolineae bacterium]